MWYQALTRAWNDESFRQALLDDASSAIQAQEAAALPKYVKEIPQGSDVLCCIC
jgi:hypothetical protein